MNVIILKNNLKDGLWAISGARKDSGQLPILKNFLLETRDDKLCLSSTDLELGVIHTISAKIIENGSVTVPFSVFFQIINNISSERITLETKGNSLFINTDNYKAKISIVARDEFPIIPHLTSVNASFSFDSSHITDVFSSVVPACHISDLRPELSGVLFSYKDSILLCAATDSFRLAEKTVYSKKYETSFDGDIAVIIPLKTVLEVIRLFSQKTDSSITVSFDEHQVLFENNSTKLISRLIEGTFPDYTAYIPKEFETEVIIDREDITSALKLTSSLTNRLNEIQFFTDEHLKNLTVFSSSQEFGENEYLLSAKISGSQTRVAFNWKFVLDGLKNIKTKTVFLGFNGEQKPSVIKSPDDPLFLYIIMPIKSS